MIDSQIKGAHLVIALFTGAVLGVVAVPVFTDPGPKVVVNMPAGAAPLEALAPLPEGTRVVESDRAVLWWTVFKHSMDQGYGLSASDYADQAVDKAYGPKPEAAR